MESDGQMIFHAHRLWRELTRALQQGTALPGPLKERMKAIAAEQDRVFSFDELRDQVEAILQPARLYMAGQELEHSNTIGTFRCASLWNPTTAKTYNLSPEALRGLVASLPWLGDDVRLALETEIPAYKAICDQVEGDVKNILHFFRDHQAKIPTWAKVAKTLALIQPSSASIERVWSLFSRFFVDAGVKDALIDYIRYILMIKYNRRSANGDDCTPAPEVPGAIFVPPPPD
jgi:hypothetical protein